MVAGADLRPIVLPVPLTVVTAFLPTFTAARRQESGDKALHDHLALAT